MTHIAHAAIRAPTWRVETGVARHWCHETDIRCDEIVQTRPDDRQRKSRPKPRTTKVVARLTPHQLTEIPCLSVCLYVRHRDWTISTCRGVTKQRATPVVSSEGTVTPLCTDHIGQPPRPVWVVTRLSGSSRCHACRDATDQRVTVPRLFRDQRTSASGQSRHV